MKEWFRYFRFWFLILAIAAAVFFVTRFISGRKGAQTDVTRINEVCTETERVFDYADVLTEEEEDKLRELIAEREKRTQCDIVLVIMNESLEEYARQYDSNAYGNDYTMIKADNFYDEHGFGWNKFQESDDGDGVLLLDNWYRESDGKVYTWFSTSGKAETRYSTYMIDHLLDEVYRYIKTDPYKAYRAYVETFYKDMTSDNPQGSADAMEFPWIAVIVIATVAAVIFIVINLSGRVVKTTTRVDTYLQGKAPVFSVRDDHFLRKTTTKRRIETSSGSSSGGYGGGGGHHTSSGGHSHGGGGRSR